MCLLDRATRSTHRAQKFKLRHYQSPCLQAEAWETQLLRQSDVQVFKKYSQMKLRMKREALEKLNRRANEMAPVAEAHAFLTAPLCTEAVPRRIRAQLVRSVHE